MTATILQLRDYKSPEQRQMEIERLGLCVVSQALELPSDFPIQYRRDDTAPSEYVAPDGDFA